MKARHSRRRSWSSRTVVSVWFARFGSWCFVKSHHLILSHPTRSFLAFHCFSSICIGVFDEAQAQRSTAVHVPSEFGYIQLVKNAMWGKGRTVRRTNCRLSIISAVKLDHSTSTRSTIGLILNFSSFDLTDCGKEFNQIIVACWPG